MTSYYQRQMPPAEGFFDPTMPGPNIAAGARDMIGRIIEKQRYEDAQRVQEEKLQQGQEAIDIDRLRAEAYQKYVEGQQKPSMPDWIQKGMFLSQMDPETYPTPGHGVSAVLKIKKPEQIPAQVDPEFESNVLLPQYGKDWRKQLAPERFWDVWKEYEITSRPRTVDIQTEGEYREEVMDYKLKMDDLKARMLNAIGENMNADIMVQFGDESQKAMAAQRYQQQGAEAIKRWEEQYQRGLELINQAYLKGSAPGKTPGSSGTALGGGEPKPPAGWVKTGTTPDGRTIYLTPEGKRKVWGGKK